MQIPTTQRAGDECSLQSQTAMVDALRRQLEAAGRTVVRLETHISWVLVCGGHACKIKKALRNPFLDQSTLALRRHACEEELRLNRRLAPDLYLAVLPVTGTPAAPVLGGHGAAIDYAVQMRAFAQDDLWDRLAARGQLRSTHIDELLDVLVPFHARAAVAVPGGRLGSPGQVRAQLLESLDDLARMMEAPEAASALPPLRAWEAAAFDRLGPVLARRLAQGRVRECHGDLHLGNVTRIDGRSTVFDGVEFNDDFRWIDVMSEVAFMAMDLHAHALPQLAHRFVDGYLERSGDHGGIAVLDYYLVHRAMVRAKVELLRAAQRAAPDEAEADRQAARRYLGLALRFSRREPGHAALLLTHGLSGSGKSTLTQGLLEAAGAIRIRADVERKRLAGLGPLDRGGPAVAARLYAPDMTAATYARLRGLAAGVMQAGYPAILDATFLQRAQRDAARRLAARQQVPSVILDFECNVETLRQRLRLRHATGRDASDADEAVLAAQLRTAEPLGPDERAAAYRCSGSEPEEGGAPSVDWTPLLAQLGIGEDVPAQEP